MKRKTLVRIHVSTTIIATLTIAFFFVSSATAEIVGDETFIKKVKEVIFFLLPVMIVTMPILGITGNKLANKSQSPMVNGKRRRMKFIAVNGLILIFLASLLYYRSHYLAIDNMFLAIQFGELAFGFTNLLLIGMNIRDGLQLSGRLKKNHQLKGNTV